MTENHHSVVEFFRALITSPSEASAFLAPEVTLFSTGAPVHGREDVIVALLRQDNGLVKDLKWSEPEVVADGIRFVGQAPHGLAKLGYVVTATTSDGVISSLHQQDIRDARMAGAVRQRTRIDRLQIPDELKQMIGQARNVNPMLIACVDGSGQPNLSYRGSLFAFSDDQLAMWIRNPEGALVSCIKVNPKVALMYRNQTSKATFHFQGRARLTADPVERQRIYAAAPEDETRHDYAQLGAAVIIDLDSLEGYFSLEPGWTMLTQRRVDS